MHWMWIPLLVVAAILCALTSVFRLRSSIQKHTDELRRVMREMQLQTEQFTKVREVGSSSIQKEIIAVTNTLEMYKGDAGIEERLSSNSIRIETATFES